MRVQIYREVAAQTRLIFDHVTDDEVVQWPQPLREGDVFKVTEMPEGNVLQFACFPDPSL